MANETRRSAGEKNIRRVQDYAAEFAIQFSAFRQREIEQRYFQPYGITISEFIDRQQQWSPEF